MTTDPRPRVRILCATCGNPGVLRDAYAVWSESEQRDVLHSTYDTFFCETCERETSVTEVPVPVPTTADVARLLANMVAMGSEMVLETDAGEASVEFDTYITDDGQLDLIVTEDGRTFRVLVLRVDPPTVPEGE